MDVWMMQYISPVFYGLLSLSVAGVCIGFAVLLLGKLGDKKIPPVWKNRLWLLMLFALVVPLRIPSQTAVLPQATFVASQGAVEIVPSGEIIVAPQVAQQVLVAEMAEPRAFQWECLLPVAWVLGMVVMAVILAVGYFKILHRVMAHHDYRFQHGKIPVYVTEAIQSPGAVGLLQPKILLPAYVEELSENSLRYILLHEACHIQYGDLWKNALLLTLQVVYWFNPLVWILFRYIRQDMELCNDSRVLNQLEGSEKTAYGRSLIEVLGHANRLPLVPQMVCMVDNKANMKRRIQMIKLGEVFKKHKIVVAVVCLTVIGVLTALFLTVRPEVPQEKPDDVVVGETALEDSTLALGAYVCEPLTQGNGFVVNPVITLQEGNRYHFTMALYSSFAIFDADYEVEGNTLRLTYENPAQNSLYVFKIQGDTLVLDLEACETPNFGGVDIPDGAVFHLTPVENGILGGADGPTDIMVVPKPDGEAMVEDPWGITLSAQDVTPTGLTLVCTQSGGTAQELYTGEFYAIEQLVDGTWTPLETIDAMWNDLAWNIKIDGVSTWGVDWSYLYGTLEAGTYRLSKEIYAGKDATNDKRYTAEFQVEELEMVGDPRRLTAEELAYFGGEYFNTDDYDNLANQFLIGAYGSPEQMDLAQVFYNGVGVDYAMSETELTDVINLYGFEKLPTDVTVIPASTMERAWSQFVGTPFPEGNLQMASSLAYLQQYDCYYHLHGDVNRYGDVTFTQGTQKGDKVQLFYYNMGYEEEFVVTLHKAVDGAYKIYSNLPVRRGD